MRVLGKFREMRQSRLYQAMIQRSGDDQRHGDQGLKRNIQQPKHCTRESVSWHHRQAKAARLAQREGASSATSRISGVVNRDRRPGSGKDLTWNTVGRWWSGVERRCPSMSKACWSSYLGHSNLARYIAPEHPKVYHTPDFSTDPQAANR